MTTSFVHDRRVWTRQPQTIERVNPLLRWQRVYNFAARGASDLNSALSYGTLQNETGPAGVGVRVTAFSQLTTGEIVPNISAGITFVWIAEKFGSGATGDFMFAEQATGNGAYNFGFYEYSSVGNIGFYVHNGTAGVVAAGTGAWTENGPAVWVGTYGDGDNNVRLYRNGVLLGSTAQTGTIRRNAGALLRDAFWSASPSPNRRVYAAGISNRCMPAAEIAARFSTIPQAYGALFAPRRTRRFISSGAGAGNTIAVPAGSLTLTGLTPTVISTANQTISVPAGALTLTGLAPTVSNTSSQTIQVPAGSLTLTGFAPTVTATANQTISVPLGTLTLTGQTPTVIVNANQTIQVPSGALTITAFAPTIAQTANNVIQVPCGILTLTGFDPVITGAQAVQQFSGGYTEPGEKKKRRVWDFLNAPDAEEVARLEKQQRQALGILPAETKKAVKAISAKIAKIESADAIESAFEKIPEAVSQVPGALKAIDYAIAAAVARNRNKQAQEAKAQELQAQQEAAHARYVEMLRQEDEMAVQFIQDIHMQAVDALKKAHAQIAKLLEIQV